MNECVDVFLAVWGEGISRISGRMSRIVSCTSRAKKTAGPRKNCPTSPRERLHTPGHRKAETARHVAAQNGRSAVDDLPYYCCCLHVGVAASPNGGSTMDLHLGMCVHPKWRLNEGRRVHERMPTNSAARPTALDAARSVCVCACVRVCVCACVRACVRACIAPAGHCTSRLDARASSR